MVLIRKKSTKKFEERIIKDMDKTLKKFQITLKDGKTYNVERDSKESLLRWLNTGAAGFLPIGSRKMIRFTQENIESISEDTD